MKQMTLIFIAIFCSSKLLAQQVYNGPDPVADMEKFNCADIKVKKVNFKFCSVESPRFHKTEATYDQYMKNVSQLQNGRFQKYNDCYIQVTEKGKTKTFYDVSEKQPVCAPPDTLEPFCEAPEDNVRLIGPRCVGATEKSEDCFFNLHHKLDLKNINPDYIAYDSRGICQCNMKGCGHVISKINSEDPITKEQKAVYLEQVKKSFKEKAPECDDFVVEDLSVPSYSRQMLIAISSMKCAIINESPNLLNQHCPVSAARKVERISVTKPDGKNFVVAAACIKLPDPKKPTSPSGAHK